MIFNKGANGNTTYRVKTIDLISSGQFNTLKKDPKE